MLKNKIINLLLILFFFIIIYLSHYQINLKKINLYFFPKNEYLIYLNQNLRNFLAHLLFIKGTLELFDSIPQRMHYLTELFKTVIKLNPKIQNAYFLPAIVAPSNEEEIKEGIKFLKEVQKYDPLNWRIPYWIGFNYLELKNYKEAIKYYQIASNLPNSPSFLKTNLAYLYYQSESINEGIYYLEDLINSIFENKKLYELLEKKIIWLKNIYFLEKAIEEFRKRFNFYPNSLEELVKNKIIEKIPEDTFGKGFYLEKDKEKNIPRVKSKF